MRIAAAVALSGVVLFAGTPQTLAETAEAPAAEISRSVTLFESVAARSAPPLERSHVRSRVVRLGGEALEAMLGGERSATVELNLFADTTLGATTDLLERAPDGDLSWRGEIGQTGHEYATLVRRGGEVAGIVPSHAGTFEIVPMGGGESRVTQVHVDELPGCGVDDLNIPGNPLHGDHFRDAVARSQRADQGERGASMLRGETVSFLDQLVAYTPSALTWVGGTTSGMNAFIDNAILDMNTVLANSGIEMETRVVFKHALSEDETGDGVADRNAFRQTTDGKWDEVHQLRDDFGADIGHILVRNSNVCGIAAQIWRGSSNGDQFAFCLTAMGCVSNLTFVHEVGHVIGCAHDFANSGGSPGTFFYSFGWFDPDPTPTWHSIMSYSPGAGSGRVPYFSTPNVTWTDGNRLGDSQLADNARTINLNIPDITAWRASVGLAPATYEANSTPGQIELSWNAVPQATGYEIWRGPTDDVMDAGIRGFRPNPAYTDTSVAPDTTYFYFIRSQFADGGRSPFSEGFAATSAPETTVDLSGDGVVNSADLAILLAAWGTSAGDVSGDGTTNSVDLAILIAAWG